MIDDPLIEMVDRVLAQNFPVEAHDDAATEGMAKHWPLLVELGLPYVMVPEDAGGFGAALGSAWSIVGLTGVHALALPVAETIGANHVLAQAGLRVDDAPVTLSGGAALEGRFVGGDVLVSGTLPRVPWGGDADIVAAVTADGEHWLVRLDGGAKAAIDRGHNLARHPRDDVEIDAVVAPAQVARLPDARRRVEAVGMALRTHQLAGAMAAVLDLTVSYTKERAQFGRTLAKFQAIQQELARMAGQVAAAAAAAEAAAEAVDDPSKPLALHAAKARAAEAAGLVASIAHQAHGAIGFAAEHRLPILTRALWSWRDEFGSQAACSRVVGDIVLAEGADALWPMITAA